MEPLTSHVNCPLLAHILQVEKRYAAAPNPPRTNARLADLPNLKWEPRPTTLP